MKKKATLLVLLFILSLIALPAIDLKASGQSSITRSAAEQRAINMINLTWTYSKDRNANIDPKYAGVVEQPQQLKDVSAATFSGIPYDWGGIDSLDSHSYDSPWTSFLDAVNKGAFIGNVSSAGGFGLIPGTAGIDCSGFVQAVFNIGGYKLSTSTLFDQYFKTIDLNDIKHMDILNYAGHHVVIFDRWGTLNGIYGAYTYEATTNQYYGGVQGTKRYFLSLNAINNSYTPGRYVNIIDDSTASTPPSPPQQRNSTSTTAAKPQVKQPAANQPRQPSASPANKPDITNVSNNAAAAPKTEASQSLLAAPKTEASQNLIEAAKTSFKNISGGASKEAGFFSSSNFISASGLPNSMLMVFCSCFIFGVLRKKFKNNNI